MCLIAELPSDKRREEQDDGDSITCGKLTSRRDTARGFLLRSTWAEVCIPYLIVEGHLGWPMSRTFCAQESTNDAVLDPSHTIIRDH